MNSILLQGVGGVGGLLAGELLNAGRNVTLVTGNPDITAAINDNGIHLITPEREIHVRTSAFTTVQEITTSEKFDCALLAMMAGAVVEGARAASTKLAEDGYCVAFQNGFVEEAIGNEIGMHRVISATVALGSSMESPGHYRRTTAGRLIIGELNGDDSSRLAELKETLNAVIDTQISTNIVGVLWGKLIWNGAVSGLCAISGRTLGGLFEDQLGRDLFLLAFGESVDTARAQGVDIESVIVEPEKFYLPHTRSSTTHTALDNRLREFSTLYASVTPSTLDSLRRGRKSEIDFLNGYIIAKAEEKSVNVPLNRLLVEMVHEIESAGRTISEKNLVALADSVASASQIDA